MCSEKQAFSIPAYGPIVGNAFEKKNILYRGKRYNIGVSEVVKSLSDKANKISAFIFFFID